jgi:hypothetical protein
MNILINIRNKILTILSRIKFSPYPMWFHYQPNCYKIKGKDVRELISLILPGDIILRGFESYIDGWIIGKWSHIGIVSSKKEIIHAMSPTVFEEDVINFFRADRIVILRPNLEEDEINKAIEKAEGFKGLKYDFNFNTNDPDEVYCSELVYLCFEEYKQQLGMEKKEKKILFGLIKKLLVEPKAFLDFQGFKEIKRIRF